MTDERRQHRRKPWAHAINYQISKGDPAEAEKVTFRGQTFDISAGGLRINSDKPLWPGLMISFGETRLAGVVKWSCGSDDSFSAGIQLV
jgi:hypothetical protein